MEGGHQAGIFDDLGEIENLQNPNIHQQAAAQPHLVPPVAMEMAPNLQGANVVVGAVQSALAGVPQMVNWYELNGPVQNELVPQLGQLDMAEIEQFVLDRLLPPAAAAAQQEQAAAANQEHAAAANQEEHAAAAAAAPPQKGSSPLG